MEQTSSTRNTLLSKRIMRRVYVIAGIRALLNPEFLKVLIAAVFFVRSMKYVSYVNVFENLTSVSGPGGGYQFMKAAMFHAHPMTLVLLSSASWLAVWIAYDLFTQKREAWV